jgi:hypothetical protein
MWVIEDNGYDSVLVRLEDDNPQPEEQEQTGENHEIIS